MEQGRKNILLAAGLLLAGGLHASGPVKVTGDVTVPMSDEEQAVTITVLDAAGDTLQLHETWTGRFKLYLPEEEVITLRFSQQGCLAKDVVIDTRHALGQDLRRRRVDFGVELHPGPGQQLRYQGAVGTIVFRPGSGLMAVERHAVLVRD